MSRQQRETLKTTHKSIYQYWRDKCISSDGYVYIDVGYPGHDSNLVKNKETIPVVYDWGEPECFACRQPINELYESEKYEETLADDCDNLWNFPQVKHALNRCHIVPHALGGTDKPENLFLMCERCHKDSPDTIYKDQFFKWVFKRRKYPTAYSEAREILEKDYGINAAFYPIHLEELKNELTTHGGNLGRATLISAYVGHTLKLKNDRTVFTDQERLKL